MSVSFIHISANGQICATKLLQQADPGDTDVTGAVSPCGDLYVCVVTHRCRTCFENRAYTQIPLRLRSFTYTYIHLALTTDRGIARGRNC